MSNVCIISVNKLCIAQVSTAISALGVQSGRIGADEVINDTEGKGAEELEERLNEKEAKTRAILLEMVRRLIQLSIFLFKVSVL